MDALRRAVTIAGGQSALARIVGCSQSNIALMLKEGRPLAGKYCVKAERATLVSRYDLNPEVFDRETSAAEELETIAPNQGEPMR